MVLYLHMRSHSHTGAGQDNRKAQQLVTMRAAGLQNKLPEESRITTSVSFQNLLKLLSDLAIS